MLSAACKLTLFTKVGKDAKTWIEISLLLQHQPDTGLHCLSKRYSYFCYWPFFKFSTRCRNVFLPLFGVQKVKKSSCRRVGGCDFLYLWIKKSEDQSRTYKIWKQPSLPRTTTPTPNTVFCFSSESNIRKGPGYETKRLYRRTGRIPTNSTDMSAHARIQSGEGAGCPSPHWKITKYKGFIITRSRSPGNHKATKPACNVRLSTAR